MHGDICFVVCIRGSSGERLDNVVLPTPFLTDFFFFFLHLHKFFNKVFVKKINNSGSNFLLLFFVSCILIFCSCKGLSL